MKNILFVCYGGGHVKMVVPVVKKLQLDNNYNVSVLALTTASHVLKMENIDHFTYSDFAYLEPSQLWQSYGEELLKDNELSPLIEYEDSKAYYGINFLDLVRKYGEDLARLVYESEGRHSFLPVEFFIKVISSLNVDIVVATNSPRSERAAIMAATALNKPSVCLVDMFSLQEVDWIAKPNFATKVCVLNDSVKEMFVSRGLSKNDVIVTGNPSFDNIYEKKYNNKKRINENKKYYGISREKKVVLFASQPEPKKHPFTDLYGDPELPRIIERDLRKFVFENNEYHLIVRYHPSENISFVAQDRVTLSKKTDELYDLLYLCDLVIVTTSTVGLEASLIGKTVISVNNSIFVNDAPFSEMGISIGVKNSGFLAQEILKLSKVKKADSLLFDKSLKSSSTNNVCLVIEGLCAL